MRPSQAHFVTSCQQLLALGAVLAVLTPAASVVSLDVVHTPQPDVAGAGSTGGSGHAAELSAYTRETGHTSRVPTAPADADLTDYPLLDAGPSRTISGVRAGGTSVLSRPAPVRGYGGVGVTWAPGQAADDEDLSFSVRTRTDGDWSDWADLEYHDDHAPEPDSREGRHARPGTDITFVGHVDEVQVRADAEGILPPSGMSMTVVEPGAAPATDREAPAIDTATLPSARTTHRGRRGVVVAGRHPPPQDLLPRAVGGRRVDARQGLAALLRGPRRLRPPHGQRQRLQPRRGARAAAQHLRLPHPVPRLERRGLQLPGRPVRPDLGGPVRRGRPSRRRRPHPRLQRLLLRDVGDRQLRHRPAQQRDGRRPTAPCSRGSCRCTASTPPRPTSRSARTPSRRSTATATPARPRARGATSTRRSTGSPSSPPTSSRTGRAATSAPTSPPPTTPTSSSVAPETARPSCSRPAD